MCGINYNITFWRIIRVGLLLLLLLLLLLIDDDDDDDDAKVRRDASWLDVDTLDMTTRTSSSNHVIAVTSRAWLIDVTRHAARACAFKCVSGVTCFYERRKNCAARLLSTSMTSSGDSTVNCVILILHVKITHCSTNCVNDYINIVVNRQLFVFSTSSVYSRLASSNFIHIFCKCRFLCQKLYVFYSFTAQHNNSLHANNRCCISLTSKRFYSTYSAY